MRLTPNQINHIIGTITEDIFIKPSPYKQIRVTVTDKRNEPEPFINIFIEMEPIPENHLCEILRSLKPRYGGHIVIEAYDLNYRTIYDIDILITEEQT